MRRPSRRLFKELESAPGTQPTFCVQNAFSSPDVRIFVYQMRNRHKGGEPTLNVFGFDLALARQVNQKAPGID